MTKRNTLIQYGLITVACVAYAFGFDWCYDANHISVGGFTGIAQIINFFLPWAPVGTVTWIMNVPLFLVGWKLIGKRLFFASLYGMTITSVFIDLFAAMWDFQPMDPLLAALYGGVIAGAAAGVMMRQDANTGGTELAARLLKLKFEGVSMGTLMLSVDVVVTVVYALIFKDFTRALYGMVGLYVSSIAMDRVIYGANASGGLDIVGLYLSKMGKGFTVGRFSMGFNIVLYLVCLFVFDASTAIYSAIYNVFASLFLDRAHQQNIAVQVLIFSKDKRDEINQYILQHLRRGVTSWKGQGGYTGEDVQVLCVCLSKYEVESLQRTVHEIDPAAFFIVQEGVQIGGNFDRILS